MSQLSRLVAMAALTLTVVSNNGLGAERDAAAAQVAVERGAQVYFTYCVSCHGVQADGNGRRARVLTVPPTDLRFRYVPDSHVESIIRQGGEAVGRSSIMPPWADELGEESIQNLLAYLDSIRVNR